MTLKNIWLISVLALFFSVNICAEPETVTQSANAGAVKIVNSSTSNVYWHYQQGVRKEIVGLLKAGQSDVLPNVTFTPNQLTTVTFKCDKADTWTCAKASVDITTLLPSTNDNVTTVFSYKSGVVLSFDITQKDGAHQEVFIGDISIKDTSPTD